MDSSVHTLSRQFALHNRLFNNVLEDVQDVQGDKRVNEHVNHLQWISGHLVTSRYRFAPMLGKSVVFPYADKYSDDTQPPPGNRIISASIDYPSISEITRFWNDLAPAFAAGVDNLSEEQVAFEMPFSVPVGGNKLMDLLTFIASHEAYHIGQMSLIRKYLGLRAMSYK